MLAIPSHNLMMGGVTYFATLHGGYSCELVFNLHTGAMGGDQIDGLLTNWRVWAPTRTPRARRGCRCHTSARGERAPYLVVPEIEGPRR